MMYDPALRTPSVTILQSREELTMVHIRSAARVCVGIYAFVGWTFVAHAAERELEPSVATSSSDDGSAGRNRAAEGGSTSSDPKASRKAMQHFERGVQHYERGDFKAALLEFELAYETVPHPAVLYNLGVVQVDLQDFAGAYLSFRRYLDDSEPGSLTEERIRGVEERLEVLDSKVGYLNIRVEPSGSQVRINGSLAGTTPASVPLNIGHAEVEVSHADYLARRERVMVLAGKTFEMIGALEPETGRGPVERKPAEDVGPSHLRRLWVGTWVMTGIGGASAVAAVATGTVALLADSELRDALGSIPDDPAAAEREREELEDRIAATSLATDILAGVAVAAAVTAIGLGTRAAILRRRAHRSTAAAVQIHPNLGHLTIQF